MILEPQEIKFVTAFTVYLFALKLWVWMPWSEYSTSNVFLFLFLFLKEKA